MILCIDEIYDMCPNCYVFTQRLCPLCRIAGNHIQRICFCQEHNSGNHCYHVYTEFERNYVPALSYLRHVL